MNEGSQAPLGGIAPDATAEQLAELAAARPELWGAIAEHPNAYAELRQWARERLAERARVQAASPASAPAPVASAPTFAEVAGIAAVDAPGPFGTPAPGAPPAATSGRAPQPPKRGRGLVVALSVVGAVAVLAGAGAALWFTGALHTLFGWDTSLSAGTVEVRSGDGEDAETEAADAEIVGIALPDGFGAECPRGTLPLAWAEFGAGWALVCGVDEETPSFAELKLPSRSGTLSSVGAESPTGSAAKAAILWKADLGRYVISLDDGTQATLDYEIGTVSVRDPAAQSTVAQHRLERYVFLPEGEAIRTLADSAQSHGAFGVQAPTATAEDQVRYMIQVLETAYQGRELVKQALPKLQSCAAGPGGYTDTIAQMEAVRDNRATLLQALDAMPVDLIPEGQLLLDDLRRGIEYSYQANGEYVAWAQAANASGCAQLSAAGQNAAAASDAPKQAFAARWNAVVAPQFGVRTFDPWYI